MENKKNNKEVMALLIVIIVILAVLCVLFAIGTINLNSEIVKTNQSDNNISNNPDDYISIEKVNIGDNATNVEKVIFKNLDSSLTQKFTEEQTKLIDAAEDTYFYFYNESGDGDISNYHISGTNYLAISTIWYQINRNILTVYYKLTDVNEIGECERIAVTNIDLLNKKILSNAELLALGNSSFNSIATNEYNKLLKVCNENKSKYDEDVCYYSNEGDKKVTIDELQKNKQEFINNLEEKLDSLIKAYINDGKVKYDYKPSSIKMTYGLLNAGGCFPYETAELGEYK